MNAATATRRPPPRTPHPRSAVGGTLLGVFIGIVVGLGMAATVAYWLMKNNPALSLPSLAHDARDYAVVDRPALRAGGEIGVDEEPDVAVLDHIGADFQRRLERALGYERGRRAGADLRALRAH